MNSQRDGPDEPRIRPGAAAADGLSVRRVVGALGAVVGATSLAGCETLPGEDDPTAGDTTVDAANRGESRTVDSTSAGSPTSTAERSTSSTPERSQTPSPAAGEQLDMSSEECEVEVEELDAKLESVRASSERVAEEREELAAALDRLEVEREVLESKPTSLLEEAETVGSRVREAVVFLELEGGHATGWYVDDRHVVTNAHNVVDDATGMPRDAPTIWTLEGEQSGSTVVEFEPELAPDVAILESDRPAPASLDLADEPAGSGDVVVQVGNPGSVGNWVVSVGEVQRIQEVIADDGVIEELVSDVPGTTGVSGSPIVTLDGAVVGMTMGGSDRDQLQPGERPVPHPAILYDRHLAIRAETRHVALDQIEERYDRWV